MAMTTAVPAEVQLDQTYEVPASLLSNEPVDEQDTSSLRAAASNDDNGVCYVHLSRLLENGVYLARVAARPEDAARGFTLIVTDEQMAQAKPYVAEDGK